MRKLLGTSSEGARKCEERADTETCKTIIHESFQNYRHIICQISIIVIEDIYLYEKILQPFEIGNWNKMGGVELVGKSESKPLASIRSRSRSCSLGYGVGRRGRCGI